MIQNISKYRLYEDFTDEPIWLRFTKTFTAYNKKQFFMERRNMQRFEQDHPLLKLVHVEYGITMKNVVKKEPLFSDSSNSYHEIRYSLTPKSDRMLVLRCVKARKVTCSIPT